VRDAVLNLGEQLKQRRRDNEEDIQRLPDWPELTAEQKGNILSLLDTVALEATEDLVGLKQLLARDYELNTLAGELKDSVRRQGQDNRRLREERELAELKKKGVKKVQRAMCFPIVATSLADLDALIARLQTLKTELQSQASANDSIEVSFTVGIQVQD
jgi:hypothetical protein